MTLTSSGRKKERRWTLGCFGDKGRMLHSDASALCALFLVSPFCVPFSSPQLCVCVHSLSCCLLVCISSCMCSQHRGCLSAHGSFTFICVMYLLKMQERRTFLYFEEASLKFNKELLNFCLRCSRYTVFVCSFSPGWKILVDLALDNPN